jgi:hypothetical protein
MTMLAETAVLSARAARKADADEFAADAGRGQQPGQASRTVATRAGSPCQRVSRDRGASARQP